MNLVSALLLSLFWVFESVSVPLGYLSGAQLNPESLASVTSQIQPGTVLIVGEKHYNSKAQSAQLEVLKALRLKGLTVSVGLEFISYMAQAPLDLFRQGQLSESDFIKQSEWGSTSFDGYRELAQFPLLAQGEQTRGINAPRQLTGKISKSGLLSLSPADTGLLPPGFQLGRASYRKRFDLVMAPHVPSKQAMDNYFAAQSVWDDTMAWQTAEFLSKNPNHVFVIIVGEFHVQYGGGLADRLKARGVSSILTLSQVDHSDYSDEELKNEVTPHPEFGPRADYLWIF